ncbi:MAG: hypothetical protein AAF750_14305 [Planctomycetota bacterium]
MQPIAGCSIVLHPANPHPAAGAQPGYCNRLFAFKRIDHSLPQRLDALLVSQTILVTPIIRRPRQQQRNHTVAELSKRPGVLVRISGRFRTTLRAYLIIKL